MILEWQYTGRAPWNEIVKWCEINFGRRSGRYFAAWETIKFSNERDYVFFLLRWA
jgi:hypothetical protein